MIPNFGHNEKKVAMNKLLNIRLIRKLYIFISQFFDPRRALFAVPNFIKYLIDLYYFKRLCSKNKEWRGIDLELFPQLHDSTPMTKQDPHYFYQGVWAMRRIILSGVKEHFDVGSQIDFVRYLSIMVKVNFVDIRPIDLDLLNLLCQKGSIVNLPFRDNSIFSLSTLHVIEHIGLGRYGDSLDPIGSYKAAQELIRVLAPGGKLYLSTPIGRPRICFNAHIIRTPLQVCLLFDGLDLVEFSVVQDDRKYIEKANMNNYIKSNYACGLFVFTKPVSTGLS